MLVNNVKSLSSVNSSLKLLSVTTMMKYRPQKRKYLILIFDIFFYLSFLVLFSPYNLASFSVVVILPHHYLLVARFSQRDQSSQSVHIRSCTYTHIHTAACVSESFAYCKCLTKGSLYFASTSWVKCRFPIFASQVGERLCNALDWACSCINSVSLR